ncbi:hypothetical protein [Microbacterium oxydans]|uniref:hypothetical protein n=1 Tax=Microbacterium oxydans TaxID=82380 RepID=UPI0024AD5928|nr:hypothetical protein [Microbacterium oxydans]
MKEEDGASKDAASEEAKRSDKMWLREQEATPGSGAGGLEGKVVGGERDKDGVHVLGSFRSVFPGSSRCVVEPRVSTTPCPEAD